MTETPTMGQRLADLHRTLTPAEQANLKLILGLSAGQLVPDKDPSSEKGRQAVSEALTVLAANPHAAVADVLGGLHPAELAWIAEKADRREVPERRDGGPS
ncbi:hypothetical protein E2C11_07470 [Streptomyces lavendulae]|nr:hypothetical protein [Streptomyces lavendulae]TXJ83303.1 hypothetical protein E2C11_07470 [Streptomyces lavendulae]